MDNESIVVDDELDATGLVCPEPVMLLHNKIHHLNTDGVLKVIATDPSTQRDIPKFCEFLGHRLLSQEQDDRHYYYFIQKK